MLKKKHLSPGLKVVGKGKINIIHTQLRHHRILTSYEILQREEFFLFGLHEDAYHYFFTCTNYTNARNNYFHKFLLQLGHFCVINTHLLLWGDESLSTIINNQLIFSVFALPFFCNSIYSFQSTVVSFCTFLSVFVLMVKTT